MATAIRFGPFRAVATHKQYIPISDFTKTASLRTKENDSSSGKQTVKKEGPGLRSVKCNATLTDAFGVSPESQYNTLQSLCESGKPYMLFRNGKPESKYRFLLKSVSISDVEMNPSTGKILSGTVELEFQEYPNGGPGNSKAEKKR